jgi:hypothetical protein
MWQPLSAVTAEAVAAPVAAAEVTAGVAVALASP